MNTRSVLIIDDDELFRKFLRLALVGLGFAVTEAKDGLEGIRCYKKDKFDLVITDLVMPGKEGLETIRELRQLDPTVRIIAISGGGRAGHGDYLPLARAFGAAEVMDKPFTPETLNAAITKVLGAA
jgi:CheY-like chemotaxis protein